MMNIDSEFDAKHICEVACRLKTNKIRVLIRINPHLDPHVHPYNSTALEESKFGIESEGLQTVSNSRVNSEYLFILLENIRLCILSSSHG